MVSGMNVIKTTPDENCNCTAPAGPSCCGNASVEILSPDCHAASEAPDVSCCGPPAGPPSSPHERPGFKLCRYVEALIDTPAGPVPRIKTILNAGDRLGTLGVRLGIGRNDYKVAPGLYAAGFPDSASPVVVTANYKLSFDHLRSQLAGTGAWILVLDTRGINVWCAAGKGTFGTDEIIRRVKSARISDVVTHRRLILPQLGAVGVSAHKVRKGCGFEVVWGPIRARDLKAFLRADGKIDESMRRVTFSFGERLVLIPVELSLLRKYLLWALVAMFVLSGIGRHVFSFSAAWHRGLLSVGACLSGILAGCVLVPAFLPWIPGRAFSLKGAQAGLVMGIVMVALTAAGPYLSFWPGISLVLVAVALGSFLAMNFTGSTPFTSPSGVEKEMRRAIPLQLAATLLAVGIWIGSGF